MEIHIKNKHEKELGLKFGKYNINENPKIISGLSPSFILSKLGFKQEYLLDLLKDYRKSTEILDDGLVAVSYGNIHEINKVRGLAGSDLVLERKRGQLNRKIRQLNSANIDYLLFRSYRNFPATWDQIEVYSNNELAKSMKGNLESVIIEPD